MITEDRDYYKLLGVAKNATEAEIKKAYRQAAFQYHPDRNPGNAQAEEQFKLASEAYEVLSDPNKRSIYDQYGYAGLKGQGFSGFHDVNDIFSSFSSIFEDFFGFSSPFGSPNRGRRGSRAQAGADLRYDLDITLEEAAFGATKTVEFTRNDACKECQGSGAERGSSAETCSTCRGNGQVAHSQGFFTIASTCPSCHGAGSVIKKHCPECRGRGTTPVTKKLSINIPAGVDAGTSLRHRGEGEAGRGGGPSGDLYVVINLKPHEVFDREGNDVIVRVPISFPTAVLGGEIEVPTLAGKTRLRIQKGTTSGKVHRIRGEGIKDLRANTRGNLLVQTIIHTPTRLTKKQEELLKQLATELGDTPTVEEVKKSFFQKVYDSIT